MFKKINLQIVLLINLLYSTQAFTNIHDADQLYLDKDYQRSIELYRPLAEIGNKKAQYLLAQMHYSGKGVKQNIVKAVVWFAVAEEYNYKNSRTILANIMAHASDEQKQYFHRLITKFKTVYGRSHLEKKYYPDIIKANLKQAILTQGVGGQLQATLDFSQSSSGTDFGFDDEDDDFNDEQASDDDWGSDIFNQPYLLITDFIIAPDGSIRDVEVIESIGEVDSALYDIKISNGDAAAFNGEHVYFTQRAFNGIADKNKREMRDEYPYLYYKVARETRKLQDSTLPHEQYLHAVNLLKFPWLSKQPEQAEALLSKAANAGLGVAQYTYSRKLYREQSDIGAAIYWLTESAKQGITQAQYHLARLFLESPWVVKDETKAYYWLSQASQANHIFASRLLAKLKLLAKDEQLHDAQQALAHLEFIKKSEDDNPEFHYLLAHAYTKPEQRQFSLAVTELKKAISLGDEMNWDTQQWQALLEKWTSGGRVLINELS